MNTPQDSLLGRQAAYPRRRDAGLLFAIARAPARAELGIEGAAPFHGVDVWNAYELSWLDPAGRPQVALGEFRVPADSPNLIESKSLKLYLAGFHQERFDSVEALRACVADDLARAAGAAVAVALTPPGAFADVPLAGSLAGTCIDAQDIAIDAYGPPDPGWLQVGDERVEESLVSDLLKSNCPVTGQPDWASVQVRYAGQRIDPAGLLRYLVSFREHSGFHEQCVERIFVDIQRACAPTRLSVYARYTRRGGLDINPWRSSHSGQPDNPRLARQ